MTTPVLHPTPHGRPPKRPAFANTLGLEPDQVTDWILGAWHLSLYGQNTCHSIASALGINHMTVRRMICRLSAEWIEKHNGILAELGLPPITARRIVKRRGRKTPSPIIEVRA